MRPVSLHENIAAFAALTPTLPPATHTQSYAIGGRDLVLVEPATPYPDEQAAWLAWARGLQSQGQCIVAIVLTHHHADHVGGARFFAEALSVPLWAHAVTASLLSDLPISRMLSEGDEIVLEGSQPTHVRVLHTPGHAAGHICLYLEDPAVLVCGDMMASVGTILIDPREGDMSLYLGELARLEALNAQVALPAHGEPILEPSQRLRAYIAHRLKREDLIRQALLHKPHGASIDEILPLAYSDTDPSLYPLARLSLEAHLIKLVDDGEVVRQDDQFLSVT